MQATPPIGGQTRARHCTIPKDALKASYIHMPLFCLVMFAKIIYSDVCSRSRKFTSWTPTNGLSSADSTARHAFLAIENTISLSNHTSLCKEDLVDLDAWTVSPEEVAF